jgi:putative colanic acid biosysnthesis UDP-glucose lipid carrier transferase
MNEPVIARNYSAIALIALLQHVAPAIVAVSCLYLAIAASGMDVAQNFDTLAIVVGALSLLIQRPPRTFSGEFLSGTGPIAVGVIMRWMIVLAILLGIGYGTKVSEDFSRRIVLTWAVVTPAMLVFVTLSLNEIMRRLLSHPANARKTVFAGCNEASLALARQIKTGSSRYMTVTGFFDDRGRERLNVNGDVQLLGKLNQLSTYVRENSIGVIFIALPMRHVQRVMNLLDDLRDTTASIYYVPDIFMFDLVQAKVGSVEGVPVISVCETPFYGFRGVTKRMADILLSSLILLMAAPVMAAVALAIRFSSPGPVIFRQKRYGLNGEEINVYKFRTMTVQENGSTVVQATKDDRRVTPLGRVLRRYSLDELPQLINVLQGRMSLVGPRPHAVAHNEMYRKLIKGYMMRHKVLPGITGWAQVNGLRGETRTVEQMEARVKYDIEYLRNWSIALDLQILAKTLIRVVNDRKAY